MYKQLQKRDADQFGSCDLPIFPSCLVTVWANLYSNPEEHLRLPVKLTGIDSITSKLFINRFLERMETSDRGRYNLSYIKLKTSTDSINFSIY